MPAERKKRATEALELDPRSGQAWFTFSELADFRGRDEGSRERLESAFATGASTRPRSHDELLTPVATLTRHESALALRAVLSDAGIRSTLRRPAAHRTDVLVFPEDLERARALAMSFGG